MRGKSKLALIGLAVVLGLTALGLGINSALASSDDAADTDAAAAVATSENQTSPQDIFVSKLADKLGLDEETVANAIKEVRQEMRDEALAKRLQEAVDEGTITQDKADQILAWMQSRPAALDELRGFGPEPGPECGGGGQMRGPHGPPPF